MKKLIPRISSLKKIPYFTSLLVGLCIALYFAISFVSDFGTIDEDTYEWFGAPYAVDIYLGQYWGVISNSFIHVLWYQLAGNLILLLVLGTIIERRIGAVRLFLFGLFASGITSCIQLTFSDDAGLGLSGVNYALFGFVFIKYYIDERFKGLPIPALSTVMTTLLVFCIYLNLYHEWNFGLTSMYSGLLWGALVGSVSHPVFRWVSIPVLIVSTGFCVASLFYAPWSTEWHLSKGVEAHESGDLEKARREYNACLKIDPGHQLAKENLTLIEIDVLSNKAYKAHQKGDYALARDLYLQILKLDRKNRWAKENLKQLP